MRETRRIEEREEPGTCSPSRDLSVISATNKNRRKKVLNRGKTEQIYQYLREAARSKTGDASLSRLGKQLLLLLRRLTEDVFRALKRLERQAHQTRGGQAGLFPAIPSQVPAADRARIPGPFRHLTQPP
jgi:hypothetical protein